MPVGGMTAEDPVSYCTVLWVEKREGRMMISWVTFWLRCGDDRGMYTEPTARQGRQLLGNCSVTQTRRLYVREFPIIVILERAFNPPVQRYPLFRLPSIFFVCLLAS
jgi:hypothetical protein